MAQWLSRMKASLSGESDAREAARKLLLAAQRARVKLELEYLSRAGGSDATMASVIEQVDQEDFVISRPVVGGAVRQLGTHEQLRLSFVTARERVSAETRCLGRAKIPSGGKRVLYGYRLLIPQAMEVQERRTSQRVTVGFDLAPEVELTSFGFEGPVRGVIIDISAGGLQVRSHNAVGKFAAGQQVYVSTLLPDPVGELGEVGEVAWVRRGKVEGQTILGVRFLEPIERVGKFVITMGHLRSKRRHAG